MSETKDPVLNDVPDKDFQFEPPMVEAHDWYEIVMHEKPRLWIGTVKNHPRFGTARDILTSSILWINRETRLCQTRNTLYRLMNEASK